MGQIKYLGIVLMIAVFSIAIVSYVTNYSNDNGSVVNISTDKEITSINSDLKSDVITLSDDVNSSSEIFAQSNTEGTSDTFKSPNVLQNLLSVPQMFNRVIKLIRTKIFGGGDNNQFNYALSALSIFLIVMGVLYVWKTFRAGDPD